MAPHQSGQTGGVFPVPRLVTYIADYERCLDIVSNKKLKTFCNERLQALDLKFDMHQHLNGRKEENQCELNDNVDLNRVTKVDTHIHATAAASADDLCLFIKTKLETYGDEIVLRGKPLRDICAAANMTPSNITIDRLDIQGDVNLFDRFDLFNDKYAPGGSRDLKSIFLSIENDVKGRYLAELLKVTHGRNAQYGTYSEWRISVKGQSKKDWTSIANWIIDHDLDKLQYNRWMVQHPRIYNALKEGGKVQNYGQILQNFFEPLFAATLDPVAHPKLSSLLECISGFDSVDDESTNDEALADISPADWVSSENPGYSYQLYHFWANITVLNRLRASKGLNTYSFRPHCGESGDKSHLAAGYLLTNGVAHGINLIHSVSLQYLYYLDQIGIHCSPVSNNFLFLKLKDNPFFTLFCRGLNITLSTDDPMIFHLTPNALMEEYAIARIFWSMSTTDLSEVARNSVIQSSFPDAWKLSMLGANYHLYPLSIANDPHFTNIAPIRAIFREDCYNAEMDLLKP